MTLLFKYRYTRRTIRWKRKSNRVMISGLVDSIVCLVTSANLDKGEKKNTDILYVKLFYNVVPCNSYRVCKLPRIIVFQMSRTICSGLSLIYVVHTEN